MVGNTIGEIDELFDGELLGAEVEEGVGEERGVVGSGGELGEKRTDVVPEGLAALVEGGLHDLLEQVGVAVELLGVVAHEPDDGRAYLGWRVEDGGFDGEKVLGSVPRLNEYAENAIGFGAWPGTDTVGDFFLNHARATGDEVAVVEHLEEYLTANIVGIVAGENEGVSLEGTVEVHL